MGKPSLPAAMSCRRWPARRQAFYFRPFLLTGKDQRVKADIMGLTHVAGAPPPCRPSPRTLPGRSLAFPFSQIEAIMSCQLGKDPAAMSCQHRLARWRASMAAAGFSSHVIPTLACAAARDLWLRPFIVICPIMKTRHCISG